MFEGLTKKLEDYFHISMQIYESTLFPKIRNTVNINIIVAFGASCQHQIKDWINKIVKHSISLLNESLVKFNY